MQNQTVFVIYALSFETTGCECHLTFMKGVPVSNKFGNPCPIAMCIRRQGLMLFGYFKIRDISSDKKLTRLYRLTVGS